VRDGFVMPSTARHGEDQTRRPAARPGLLSDLRDAALLVPVIRGALPPDDPRSQATVHAVRAELAEDGYVYRFRHDARALRKAEGAFLLCGFWLAQVAHVGGDRTTAAHWFERSRAACGPAGLYTEEYDVHQRQLRGNLPGVRPCRAA